MEKEYKDFTIGEICLFKKTFTDKDFDCFSLLSGDTNPLHHDNCYAQQCDFKQKIVPLHLASAPLSAIAGVVFPGNRSLYLGLDLKAINPVPYNVELTYSAKIIEKVDRDKTLIIRTIVFNKEAIYIEAIQHIQVRGSLNFRNQVYTTKSDKNSFLIVDEAVLITGAVGEIGRSIALALAKNGKKLVLNIRKNDFRLEALIIKLKNLDCVFELLELDLEVAGKALIKEKIKHLNFHVGSIIHCACPAVNKTLSEHIKVNFESLQNIFSAVKCKWLSYQSGHIIFISSSATHTHPEGWENYVAAKSATENYIKGIQQRYAHYGIKTNILALGKVNTRFSENVGLDTVDSLLAEQVAEEVVFIHEQIKPFYTFFDIDLKREGTVGFIENKIINSRAEPHQSLVENHHTVNSIPMELSDSLKYFFNHFFKISEQLNWDDVAINRISSWDSLRHIEFLIALESEFDISITAMEIDKTKSFQGILELLTSKKNK